MRIIAPPSQRSRDLPESGRRQKSSCRVSGSSGHISSSKKDRPLQLHAGKLEQRLAVALA
jgi:hypothetical protein